MTKIFRILPHFLVNSLQRQRIKPSIQTLRSMVFSLSKESCVGCHHLAPACSNSHIEELYTSIEDIFLSWREKFWTVISNTLSTQNCLCNSYQVIHGASKSNEGKAGLHILQIKRPPFDASNPFLAQVIMNKELHKGGDRSCLHVEFDISNSKMEYEAGDYVAVYPKNDVSLVERLGELTDTNLNDGFSFATEEPHITYDMALSHYLEVTALPSTDVIKKLAEYCANERDRNKMLLMATNSKEGKALYKTFIEDASRNIVHMLEDIKSCRPPLDYICRLMPRLQPRYYSISSSPKGSVAKWQKTEPLWIRHVYVRMSQPLFSEIIRTILLKLDSVHVTAVVVKYKTTSGRVNKGVTTSWLAQHRPEHGQPLPRVPIYIRKSEFRLPIRTQTPIIMVGTGTGLAPFRGFLQERAHARWNGEEVGDTILYFGCRHRQQDFIYQEELEEYEQSGLLKLNLAFSRDQAHKVYVTHLLEKNLQQIWDVLGNRNGHFYVCGDAKNMAVDVRKIVLRAIKEVGGKSDADAVKLLNKLDSNKKYCSDVWN